MSGYDIGGERGGNCAEGCTDDDGDGEVDDVAAENKIAKSFLT